MRRSIDTTGLVLALTLGFLAVGPARAKELGKKASDNARVDAVWAREALYWRLVKAGDVDGYRALWDDRFRGWPCTSEHTATKAVIADWVRDIRDKKIEVTYALTQDGVADVGDTIVTYYTTPIVYEYPDGHVENRGTLYKFTHTWHKEGDSWLIVGGMCGELAAKATP